MYYFILFQRLLRSKIILIRSLLIFRAFKSAPSNVRFGKISHLRKPENISIGSNSFFDDYLYLTSWGNNKTNQGIISIGSNCSFGAFNHISSYNSIYIGNNFLSGKWVTISDNNHGDTSKESLIIPPLHRRLSSKGPIVIGDNVWVGDKVTILSGVKIGNNVVIAANSVVVKDIPSFSVVAGVPCKIVKTIKVNDI